MLATLATPEAYAAPVDPVSPSPSPEQTPEPTSSESPSRSPEPVEPSPTPSPSESVDVPPDLTEVVVRLADDQWALVVGVAIFLVVGVMFLVGRNL